MDFSNVTMKGGVYNLMSFTEQDDCKEIPVT